MATPDRKKIDNAIDAATEVFGVQKPAATGNGGGEPKSLQHVEVEILKAEVVPAKPVQPKPEQPVQTVPMKPTVVESNKPEPKSKETKLAEYLESDNQYGAAQIELIKRTVAKDTTDVELAYFLSISKGVKLNPLTKEIWCYKQGGQPIIFASRDGFHAIAQRSPDFISLNSCEVRDGDTFTMGTKDGEVSISHQFSPAKGRTAKAVFGAYAIVKIQRNGVESKIVEWADFDRYDKKFNAWKTHPEEMIKKVAEVHAIKKMANISGIYCEEEFEIEGEGKPEDKKPKRVKKTFGEVAAAEELAEEGTQAEAKAVVETPPEPYKPGF